MQLFYAPDITPPTYTFSEEESKHAIRVLRLAVGDTISITDGRGRLFSSRITDANPKRCSVAIESTIESFEPLPYSLTMCVAPTKNIERFEWFLEKATEIGVSQIYPLLSAHSERKAIKMEREEKVITAAMKQSLKAYHPTLHPLTTLKDIIAQKSTSERYIAHCNPSQSSEGKPYLGDKVTPGADIEILIGPEGDFSPEEVQLAISRGYKEISLGEQRLRTETAAVVATTIVSIKNYLK